MHQSIAVILDTLNGWIWSPAMIFLCISSGLYFSFATRFVQIRKIKEMFHSLMHKDNKDDVGISSFQAFSLALSGRVGVGNIAGVATAIAFGGPGAVVWMWIIAFFGAGSAFAESTLAQIYKEKHGNGFCGGPAFYIEKGLRSKILASLFAVITVVSCGSFYPILQCNTISISSSHAFNIPMLSVGIFVAILIGLIIIGGIKRIASVAQHVAPVMAAIYIIISLIILIVHYEIVPDIFVDMIKGAMGLDQALGAILGSTIIFGVKRGIYSNEAGQGTGAIVSGSAGVSHPVKQGLAQSFSVYVDTLLVCTATALMILSCKTYNVYLSDMTCLVSNVNAPEGDPGVLYTSAAISSVFGDYFGNFIISLAIFFFAFTTIMAFYYYAESNMVYLLRRLFKIGANSRKEKIILTILRVITICSAVYGSMITSSDAWVTADICVGLMAWINLIAILLLSPKVLRTLKDYERQQRMNIKDPKFDPSSLKIINADCWIETENGK